MALAKIQLVRSRVPVKTSIGVPRGRYEVEDEDRRVVYGSADNIGERSSRRDKLEGKARHSESVQEHAEESEEQDKAVEETSED